MSYPPYSNMAVPYRGHIQSGLFPGRMVRIRGTVNHCAQRFAINLQCGPNTQPRDDIALHLSPRFDTNTVIRNSLMSSSWGPEENFGHFPFSPGQSFEIIILCEGTHFKIAVNGQHFVEYEHRVPYQRINHITIDGDISLSAVMFEDPPPHQVPGMVVAPPQPAYITPLPPQDAYYTQTDYYTPTYVSQPSYISQPSYVSQPAYVTQPSYIETHTMNPGGNLMRYAMPAAAGLAVGGLGGYALSHAFNSSSSDSD